MGNLTDPGKSPGLAWLIVHKDYPHADFCLIWPFARLNNGYGSTTRDGHFERAHRLMCEMIHGPAPAERPFAAHTCNRGHEGCVNPHHLVWKSVKDGKPIVYQREPGDDSKRELLVDLYSLLPLEDQL